MVTCVVVNRNSRTLSRGGGRGLTLVRGLTEMRRARNGDTSGVLLRIVGTSCGGEMEEVQRAHRHTKERRHAERTPIIWPRNNSG
jgi:hypothetical protein